MIFKYLVQDSKQFFINNGRLILIFEIFAKKDLHGILSILMFVIKYTPVSIIHIIIFNKYLKN